MGSILLLDLSKEKSCYGCGAIRTLSFRPRLNNIEVPRKPSRSNFLNGVSSSNFKAFKPGKMFLIFFVRNSEY